MRECKAVITVATGRKGTKQFPVQRVENYTTEQSIDNDADSFSIDIGDIGNQLADCTERDNEVRVSLFLDQSGKFVQIFQGIADEAVYSQDFLLSMQGRDEPSSLAIDSDAMPGRWKHVVPKSWIAARAHALGISNVSIAQMSTVASYFTDGSEKEWALWYRMARMKGMYMWSDNVGKLIIDKLGYALAPTYYFGVPNQRGQSKNPWMGVESVSLASNKQQRMHKAIVYGEDAKKGKAFVAQGIDTTIRSWRKQVLTIDTSTTAKTQAAAKTEADLDIFESIVGAQEIQLTVQDTGVLIMQNRMAQVSLPGHGIEGIYFVVGVQRQGGAGGLTQIVRLRERSFALSKRVPTAPTLIKNPKGQPDASNKPVSSISAALASASGIRWADSFVRATSEYGVPAGWDFGTFLGVLLAICAKETNFKNEREISANSLYNRIEWYPRPDGTGAVVPSPTDPWTGKSILTNPTLAQQVDAWNKTFGNSAGNPYNPFSREAGVGPMQLTDKSIKEFADSLGSIGGSKTINEMAGGRWFPDSNIRAAAKLLVAKLKAVNADPTNNADIWIGVAAYNGSGPAAQKYAAEVKALYNQIYAIDVSSAIAAVKTLPPGTTNTNVNIPGHGPLVLPSDTPDAARKAIAFCLRLLGTPYVWDGTGAGNPPGYDCSSLVTAALASGAPYLHRLLSKYPGIPDPATKNHGQTTYTLFGVGSFASAKMLGTPVAKDSLRPADLVFFDGIPPEHAGMYLTDGLFIHDPHQGAFVEVRSLGEEWYRDHYVGARRFVTWGVVPSVTADGVWLDKVGPYTVEKMAKPKGQPVDMTKPAAGIMHTTEGNTFSAALATLNANADWPNFMVGVEANGSVRIAQFYPAGMAGRSVQHTGNPPTNAWARAQIEVVGHADASAWQPANPTFDALAALLAALSRDPYDIPLTRPGGWGDTYDPTFARRITGVWGSQAGWFGHAEIPENTHWDPGDLLYSHLFTRALDF